MTNIDPNQLPHPKRILFPRGNVEIGWTSSRMKLVVGSGMINRGNTCYLNSILQALFHVPVVSNWLMSDTAHRRNCEDNECIVCAISKTFFASKVCKNAITPSLVCNAVHKRFRMGQQEDAHEFLRYLVEAMENSYLARFPNSKELDAFSKRTTPLTQIFGGYLRSAVRCLACNKISITMQYVNELILNIEKSVYIEEALEEHFSHERLQCYKCEACGKYDSSRKQFSLERAPISLCIQLQRFSATGEKLTKNVAIRPHLDLTSYSSEHIAEQLRYKLVAVVAHIGDSPKSGHYVAYGLTHGNGYYEYNDSSVKPIVLQDNEVVHTNAYLILYELVDSSDEFNAHSNNNEAIGPSDSRTLVALTEHTDNRNISPLINKGSPTKTRDTNGVHVNSDEYLMEGPARKRRRIGKAPGDIDKHKCSICTKRVPHTNVTRHERMHNKYLEGIKSNIHNIIEYEPMASPRTVLQNNDRSMKIPKLLDARKAGEAELNKCTLIISEGDSANNVIKSALHSLPGSYECNGTYPLAGVLNNANKNKYTIESTLQYNRLMNIIGLKENFEYETLEDLKTLRYSDIILAFDMDSDGVYIAGLLINFFYKHWPSILKLAVIRILIIPVVKVKTDTETLRFYTIHDFINWKKETCFSNDNCNKINFITSISNCSQEDMEFCFKDIANHTVILDWNSETVKIVDTFFNGKCKNDVKNVCSEFQNSTRNYDVSLYGKKKY